MSILAPPPPSSGEEPGPESGNRVAAWYAASRRRLGVSEDEWYSPAVERLLAALAADAPLSPAVAALGSDRGNAGFDLRETVTDLEALVETLPERDADRLKDLHTTAALTSWADAFIDRVHAPSCVDGVSGLVTIGYLRARLDELYRECAERGEAPAERYALVVARALPRSASPFVRLTVRIQVGRLVREHFPGGETAVFDEPDLLVLAPVDDRLEPRVEGLETAFAREGCIRAHPRGPRVRIERLPADVGPAHDLVDRATARTIDLS